MEKKVIIGIGLIVGVYLMQKKSRAELKKMIQEIKEKYPKLKDIPDNLIIAITEIESSRNCLAVRPEPSIKDMSIGLLQLLTKTAKWIDELYKLNLYRDFYSLFDCKTNLILGMHYLYWLQRACNYNYKCVIMSYNEGLGNYKKGRTVIRYFEKVLNKWTELENENLY